MRLSRVFAAATVVGMVAWACPAVATSGDDGTGRGGRTAAAAARCGPWMDPHQSPGARAEELLRVMTLDQKVQMVHQYLADGVTFGAAGYVPGIPSLCVPGRPT
jgi:hypothetical protein